MIPPALFHFSPWASSLSLMTEEVRELWLWQNRVGNGRLGRDRPVTWLLGWDSNVLPYFWNQRVKCTCVYIC